MLDVGIGLQNILALHIKALEGSLDGGVEHVGNAQARLVVELHAPERFSNRLTHVASSETWR